MCYNTTLNTVNWDYSFTQLLEPLHPRSNKAPCAVWCLITALQNPSQYRCLIRLIFTCYMWSTCRSACLFCSLPFIIVQSRLPGFLWEVVKTSKYTSPHTTFSFEYIAPFSKQHQENICRQHNYCHSCQAGVIVIAAYTRQTDVLNYLYCINFAILLWENGFQLWKCTSTPTSNYKLYR